METTVVTVLIWCAILFLGFETLNWIRIVMTNGSHYSVELEKAENFKGSAVGNVQKVLATLVVVIGLANILYPFLILGGILESSALYIWAIVNISINIIFIGVHKLLIYLVKRSDMKYSYELHRDISDAKRMCEEWEREREAI